MNRGLIIIAVIGVLVIVALIISLDVVISSKNKQPREDEICFTAGCIHSASKILERMNPKVDPCDDFYEFACGGFVDSTVIPDDETRIDTFSIIENKLYEQIRMSVEEEITPEESRTFTLAKTLYKTCMNTSGIEKTGLEPLRRILKKLGEWPVLEGDNWKDENFNWIENTYKFRKLGFSFDHFISFDMGIEWTNGTKHVLKLDQASLDLSREYLVNGLDDKIVKAYLNYMVDIAVILGADKQRAIRELKESLEFEIDLANISSPEEERRNFSLLNNPMTIAQLTQQYSSVNWKEYINHVLPPSVRVDDDEVVIVLEPTFLRKLEKLLRETPKRVQANYALWRVVDAAVTFLSEDIRKIQLNYYTALSGRSESQARWRECVDIVSGILSISCGALYIRKYFEKDAKENAIEIVAGIREEFNRILKKSEWMDEKTKGKALEKAAAMSTHIAYPDELLDDKKLEEFYGSLKLRPNDFIGSILDLNLFHMNYKLQRLKQPANKTDWVTHGQPAVVNAFYTLAENSIQFPAGILQETFFNNNRPRYMNYGAIGFVIGHEITHGFDDTGRQFDKKGKLVDWWAKETERKYLEKAKCIIDQYSNYTDKSTGLILNGYNTQGENIADNGGIRVAYLAYKEWVKRNGPEPKLPGLEYTPEQMFWIGAANTWCVRYRPETLKDYITTETHSPGRYRVLGPFSNMPQFSADFNCPAGCAMNPEQKCSVW